MNILLYIIRSWSIHDRESLNGPTSHFTDEGTEVRRGEMNDLVEVTQKLSARVRIHSFIHSIDKYFLSTHKGPSPCWARGI